MEYIEQGNLNNVINNKPELKGWVLENFIPEKSRYQNGSLGIKWINEEKGFTKPGFSSSEDIRTYTILFSGKMKIEFPNTGEVVILDEQGDYLYFSTAYSNHTTTILEDSVAVAIRWKEI